MKKIVAVILILIAVFMIYIGTTKGILPPTLTGIGFIAIAVVFFQDKN